MPELSIGTVADLERYIKLLLYGPPGVGKTTFVAAAPKPIFIDFENSTETLRGGPYANTPVIRDPKQIGDSEAVLRFIKSKEIEQFETIVLDTISSMYDSFLMEWMSNSPVVKKRSGVDRHIAQQYDFRKITNVLKEIFYVLQYKEMHVVLIAHEKELVEKETNRVLQLRPQLPPTAEKSVERLINEVYYMESKPALNKPATRILHVDSQGKILAKNRSRLTEATIENPTWKGVFK
jgi:phage nucleotide-binding protein